MRIKQKEKSTPLNTFTTSHVAIRARDNGHVIYPLRFELSGDQPVKKKTFKFSSLSSNRDNTLMIIKIRVLGISTRVVLLVKV